jgi:hypothetical protein
MGGALLTAGVRQLRLRKLLRKLWLLLRQPLLQPRRLLLLPQHQQVLKQLVAGVAVVPPLVVVPPCQELMLLSPLGLALRPASRPHLRAALLRTIVVVLALLTCAAQYGPKTQFRQHRLLFQWRLLSQSPLR